MCQEEQIAEIIRHITAVTNFRISVQQQQLDMLQQRLANIEHEMRV